MHYSVDALILVTSILSKSSVLLSYSSGRYLSYIYIYLLEIGNCDFSQKERLK